MKVRGYHVVEIGGRMMVLRPQLFNSAVHRMTGIKNMYSLSKRDGTDAVTIITFSDDRDPECTCEHCSVNREVCKHIVGLERLGVIAKPEPRKVNQRPSPDRIPVDRIRTYTGPMPPALPWHRKPTI
jgi:hypothetical protein